MSKFEIVLLAVLVLVGDAQSDLNDYKECTEIEDGFIKYDGVSNCVNVYTDSACTNGKWLSSSATYKIGRFSWDSSAIDVCNTARDVKMYIYLAFGGFGLLVWICVKCCEFCKNKDDQKIGLIATV